MGACWAVIAMAVLLFPGVVTGEMRLPPGFTARVYVTGEGFDAEASRAGRGLPATSTMAFDDAGSLYLARTGRRYTSGEVYDLWPLYRIPLGGARLTPATETRYFHGPPLPNAQVGALRGGRELFVTTFDRDRRIGVVYRMVDGRVELFAGGTPPPGTPPVLRQPEGAVVDTAGNVYVADRHQGTVVRFDPSGKVLDPRYFAVARPRVLAMGEGNQMWVGADGNAEAPWQPGPGELWKIGPDGARSLVLRGPMPSAIGLSPAGQLFVADRQGAGIFAITGDGTRVEFARFTDGDAPRSLVFAPATAETRRAGIAGDLFVVVISRGAWPSNDVIRVSGPFDQFPGARPPK